MGWEENGESVRGKGIKVGRLLQGFAAVGALWVATAATGVLQGRMLRKSEVYT